MFVDITAKAIMSIDIEPEEAFRILCKTLDMEYILHDDDDFMVIKNEDDENVVVRPCAVAGDVYDDRGDLFVALRNVAVNIFPNLPFRSAEYIYNK